MGDFAIPLNFRLELIFVISVTAMCKYNGDNNTLEGRILLLVIVNNLAGTLIE